MTRYSCALLGAACLIPALVPATATGDSTATHVVVGDNGARAAVTEVCVEARRAFRRSRRALVRAREALEEAETRGEKRRARRRVRAAKKRKVRSEEAREQACAPAPPVDPPNGDPQPEPEPEPANQPPQFPNALQSGITTQLQYDPVTGYLAGVLTTINVLSPAVDPDGDPVTYTWSATNGSIVGNGLSASWQRPISFGSPADGDATITALDGRGGSDTFTFRFL
jgi:hypothetical protein